MSSVLLFVFLLITCFFFFKQKTAYEMRISDWSSDVCSSDLAMGENKWKASASWPPASVKMQRLYLRSDGRANSLWGNGRLDAAAPGKEPVDRFRYHPLNPVPTVGGGDCCNGGIVVPGAFDQRSVEARDAVSASTNHPPRT